MAASEALGLLGVDAVHFYVRDLGRMQSFLTEKLDYAELGGSSAAMEASSGQKSLMFEAGMVRLIVSTPVKDGGRASRFLAKHPEGVGSVVFAVKDADAAHAFLAGREATFVTDVETTEAEGGALKTFVVTTPFGDTTFRFVQRTGACTLPYPGYEAHVEPKGGTNRFGISGIDHITSNFPTMAPALLWMEHVLGLERYWDVEFHTTDVDEAAAGSGLKSVVMWDPHSGIKFANNEPKGPSFKASQINVFAEEHRGPGVQHIALHVEDILSTVRGLRTTNVDFMPTPGTYYDLLPKRIELLGIGSIDEDIEVLRGLEVLVDGEGPGQYMLQIFLKEMAALFGDTTAGPFFFEVIQRKGDRGFGAGNFRALFESIERQQRDEGRI